MQDLLFDPPWWLLTLLVVAGVALWWSGNNRRDKTLMRVGLAVVLAGVVLGLVGWYFDTNVESVTRKTRQIVQAVDERDWDKFSSLLDQRTSFAHYRNRDEIVTGAKAAAELVGLKSVRILRLDAQQKDTVIQVNFNVLSDQERSGGRTVFTNWQLDWQNYGTGWKLTTITPVRSDQVNADQIISNLQRVR